MNKGTPCQLVQARTRGAPLKQLSISRLELLACSIRTRLVKAVKTAFHLESVPTTYWVDFMKLLSQIAKKQLTSWASFVYNRVQEIGKLTKSED
ncbi:uncharacterized protein NPIL_340781 [Nephila pilipes]|uniref:Uncharacterized protein n=1 Tax=Nephila pilipes TaxID=299642 RepID=A0A8X6U060_NEPPI|nr:uncharacterized protein NPIL_340781 [Nephila pilipes]